MKKFIPFLILPIVLLPHLSFATPLDDKQNAESVAFFAQQAQERKAWITAHQDVINKLDQYGKSLMAYKESQRQVSLGHPGFGPSTPPTPVSDSTYSAFMAHQQSDKEVFFQKLAQERQTSLGSNEPTGTSTTPSTTAPSNPI